MCAREVGHKFILIIAIQKVLKHILDTALSYIFQESTLS